MAAVGEVASLLVWLQRQSGGEPSSKEISLEMIDNVKGKEGCVACGWSKEEKEGLEVALHRTQEQVWLAFVWSGPRESLDWLILFR